MVKNGQNDHVTEVKISVKNRDFGGHQKYFWADTARMYGPSKSKIHQKIDTFVKIGTRDLTILGAKKVVF